MPCLLYKKEGVYEKKNDEKVVGNDVGFVPDRRMRLIRRRAYRRQLKARYSQQQKKAMGKKIHFRLLSLSMRFPRQTTLTKWKPLKWQKKQRVCILNGSMFREKLQMKK